MQSDVYKGRDYMLLIRVKSEYDHGMPQLQTADQPTAP